jgi:hypothetical protein
VVGFEERETVPRSATEPAIIAAETLDVAYPVYERIMLWLPIGILDSVKLPAESVKADMLASSWRVTDTPLKGCLVEASITFPVAEPFVGWVDTGLN